MLELQKLFTRLTEKVTGWIEQLVVMLPNLVAALLIVFVAGLIARWVERAVRSVLYRLSENRPISDLLGTVARVATLITGVFIALGLLQLDKTVTSLLAGIGVVGLALGFAFQDIAANFMSGFIMALRRPFKTGDLVEIAGRRGKIQRLNLRATELETLDGLSILIPNKNIFQDAIINYTRTETRRMDLDIGTAYCDDLEHVREVVCAAVQDIAHRDRAREPEVFFSEFGDSSINSTLRVWLTQSDEISFLRARSEAMIAIKKAFDQADITIPFPIRTLDFGAKVVGGERIDQMALHLAREQDAAQ